MKTELLTPNHWTYSPSPNDIDDEWESTAIADPLASNGWRSGKWQDYAGEVKAYRPAPTSQ